MKLALDPRLTIRVGLRRICPEKFCFCIASKFHYARTRTQTGQGHKQDTDTNKTKFATTSCRRPVETTHRHVDIEQVSLQPEKNHEKVCTLIRDPHKICPSHIRVVNST